MSTEIQGPISRVEAWELWGEYGNRVPLDGNLSPDAITHDEGIHILHASDGETNDKVADSLEEELPHELEDIDVDWEEIIGIALDHPAFPLTKAIFVEAHQKQQEYAEKAREIGYESAANFSNLIEGAALSLVDEGVLTMANAERVHSWLFAPDGNPYYQYTPMSQVEYLRHFLTYNSTPPKPGPKATFSFSHGIISTAQTFRRDLTSLERTNQANKIHESVHAYFSGIDAYSIIDGDRVYPEFQYLALCNAPLHDEAIAADDYSKNKNMWLNEAYTEFIARQLMQVQPQLDGSYDHETTYELLAEKFADIYTNHKKLFRRIVDTAFVDADLDGRDAKSSALSDLEEMLNRTNYSEAEFAAALMV